MRNKTGYWNGLTIGSMVFTVFLCTTFIVTCAGCEDEESADQGSGACDQTCEKILACRSEGYDDSNLQEDEEYSSMDNCVSWCEDFLESDEDGPKAIACAERASSCEILDEDCDLF